jgi:hypothetical protein
VVRARLLAKDFAVLVLELPDGRLVQALDLFADAVGLVE